MKFDARQHYDADPDAVAAAYTDPALYAAFGELPKLGTPEVLSRVEHGGVIEMQVRHRFTGHLSAAAKAVIDPNRLTWVDHSTHDLATRSVRYRLVADHYRDRFESEGQYRFEPDGSGTARVVTGQLRVRALLVGSAVEGAIVSGLREHLADEVAVVEQFLR
jgi:hypothetical protein